MDRGTTDSEPRRSESFSYTRSASSSCRRRSISFSASLPIHIGDDVESETVSEAGDIGDRALQSNRHSEDARLCSSIDHASQNRVAAPTSEDTLLHPCGYWSRDPALNTISPVSPLPEEIISPLSVDALVCSKDIKQEELPKLLDYVLCLIHLAVFGILGVGSFLMGWWGVVFKADISRISDYLAIGLTTGYLGSLTTFSGWNQKMLDLSVDGHWVFTVLGFLLGLFLAAYSIIVGVETAKGFKWILTRLNGSWGSGICSSSSNWRVDSRRRHLAVMVVSVLMLVLLWGLSGALLKEEFSSGSSGAQLWLACIVGPPGVWIRWFLARLNGRGLGRTGLFKWLPFGTLIANVSAACIMAALSTVKEAVNTQTCDTVVSGIQLGFLGCLSTVSTFIAEFNAMRESKHPWRAYAYALITICVSFGLGTLIYSVPVWTKGYE
ncbi:fluoride export protein 1 isoform X2 [Alnus glutinosa]|uniref:fluoride export protein 1 isoform X2 n=1 Tax=Alnus glutinosa TaxID=3517 RepID=UPI002D7886DF|nr:fluoride export protein 1 isoform X2 [Alnus glutinosa]